MQRDSLMIESYEIWLREASATIFILIQTTPGGPEAPYLHRPKTEFYDIEVIAKQIDIKA